jgi:ATP-binding cassette, subfamily B, bacterial PglK
MHPATQYFREVIYLLGDDKRKLPWMIILFGAVSMLDLAGLSLIVPYIALVINPGPVDGLYFEILTILGLPIEIKSLMLLFGFGLLIVFFVKMILAIFINRAIIKFSQQQVFRLRSFLMQAYQNLPYEDYLQRNSSEYINSIQNLTSQFANGVVLVGLRTLSDGIVAFVILLMLAWTNGWILGVLVLLLTGMVIGYDRFFRKSLHTYGENVNHSATKMLKGINEGIEGLKEIRILNKEKYFHQMVHIGAQENSDNRAKLQIISTAPRYILEFIMVAFIVLSVVITLFLSMNSAMLIPTLGVFGVAAIRLLPSANMLSTSLAQLRFSRHTVSLLYNDMLFLKSNITSSQRQVTFSNDTKQFEILELKDIDFRYPNASQAALKEISLSIKTGESIGIIGTSGSGKTTMLDVLLGLLEPQSGQLLYNGESIQNKLDEWRSHVAYLPQQILLIDNTLRNNVALGQNDDEINDSSIQEAICRAKLDKLVKQLPDGLNTMLGERGIRLSGGQRQRIALARAFYHSRSVLVMDESTSALDNETETEIVEEIKQLKGKITMIVIAHRHTTVQFCDRIYCFKDGCIDSIGTPTEILKL